MNWIPVSERLPKDDASVLAVALIQSGDKNWREVRLLSYIPSMGWGSGYRTYKVTHWQPLPPLPESEG